MPSRTGLLWALECLAWKPQNLPRVSMILARLTQKIIDDNWANKTESSLQAIFQSWIPQTAASVGERLNILEMLTKLFPDIVWEICIEQIRTRSMISSYSYRPRWRNDASGAGQVATHQEIDDFCQRALALMIAWCSHNEKTLGDLVESLEGMPEEDQAKVWDLIDEWPQNADEYDKAALRERIRVFALTRQSQRRKLVDTIRNRAREAYDSLQPRDLLIHHSWLFTKQWVQESLEELEDENFDYSFTSVKLPVPSVVMRLIVWLMLDLSEFIRHCLSVEEELRSKAEWCLQGLLPI